MTPPPTPFDLLARHGAFLRRLAGALTSSAADADDLVQDTWIAALEQPPRHADAPRGWLARAARRLNGKRHRGAARRRAREVLAARPEAVVGRVDAALVLQEVVRAVVALDEPLRRVVTAAYFEELSVRAIALREGVSVPTIKGRLRRARAELREALDDFAEGDRRAWSLALVELGLTRLPAPAPPAPPVPPVPTVPSGAPPLAAAGSASFTSSTLAAGSLFMMFNAKVVTAVSLVVALAVGLSLRGKSTVPEPLAPLESDSGDAPGRVRIAPGAREAEVRHAAAQVPAPAPVAARSTLSTATLTVLVTDLDGVPAMGVDVFAGPAAHPLDGVGSTGRDGMLSVRWPARGACDIVVALRARGEMLGGLRRFRVGPGEARRLVATVDASLLPSDRVFGETGFGLSTRLSRGRLTPSGAWVHSVGVAGHRGSPAEEDARRPRPGALEPDASVDDDVPFAFVSDGEAARARAGSGEMAWSFGTELVSISTILDSREIGDDEPRVRGTVHDQIGEPARGVRIVARRPGGKVLAVTRSGPDGTFDFGVSAGELELIAGHLAGGGARESVALALGDEHRFDARIDRGLILRGEARDLAGRPFAAGRVEATHALPDGLWIGIGVTGDEGRFVLPNCPAPVIAVDLAHPDVCHGLPLARHDPVATGGESWLVSVDTAAYVKTSLLPLDEDESGPVAGELRAWDARERRGARIPVRGHAGTPVGARLPVGDWSLSLGSHGPHWSDPIPLLVTRGDPIDLGPVAFEPGGWLELEAPAEGEDARVVRTDGPVDSVVISSLVPLFAGDGNGDGDSAPLAVPLPVGRYKIESLAPEREPIVREAAVRAGQTTRVPGK